VGFGAGGGLRFVLLWGEGFVWVRPVVLAFVSRRAMQIYRDENTDDTDQTDLHGYEIRAHPCHLCHPCPIVGVTHLSLFKY
jgi:hypothetical protein